MCVFVMGDIANGNVFHFRDRTVERTFRFVQYHTTVLLGRYILVFAGSSTVYWFDHGIMKWAEATKRASLLYSCWGYSATLVNDFVYIVGGRVDLQDAEGSRPQEDVLRFDTVALEMKTVEISGDDEYGMYVFHCAEYFDTRGEIILYGSVNDRENSLRRLNPDTNECKTLHSKGKSPIGRRDILSCASKNKMFVLCGSAGYRKNYSDSSIFVMTINGGNFTWSQLANQTKPYATIQYSSINYVHGKVFVFGSTSDKVKTKHLRIYDIQKDIWSPVKYTKEKTPTDRRQADYWIVGQAHPPKLPERLTSSYASGKLILVGKQGEIFLIKTAQTTQSLYKLI